MLYNNQFDVVEASTGYLPVDDRINTIQNLATDRMVMTENGYIDIFVNNDAQTPVYYDNLRVTVSAGYIGEINTYYPSGTFINNMMGCMCLGEENNYKYNAKEFELNLNWLDFGARMMDPVVGRWWVPDPLAEKYYSISPYAYCLNNPIKYIDPDGKRVVAASIDAQRMILNTLPKEYWQYVSFNIGGVMNTAGLSNVKSTSGNFDALRTMALSDMTLDVVLDNKFNYLDSKGNKMTSTMNYAGVDDLYIGNFGGKGIDTSTGEVGFLGKTLFPDLNGMQNSTNRNIIVIVNPGSPEKGNLSEKGRAEIFSHEAYGHAYIYMITNKNRKKASHNFSGYNDLNDYLYNLINRSMNETVKNMDNDDNGKDVWMILNQFLMQNPNIKVFQ